ncbi:MAG: ABC transporter permease [Rikenellaceae bacterium]|nr:ABC transporter permease [Rikenellaceae bacterium]
MMIWDRDSMQEIWVTISRNKVRSILTGFGVFWGLLMLIVLMTIGSGFRNGINQLVSGISINTCEFWTYKTAEPYKGYKSGRWWRMDNRDVELIRRKAPSVEYIVPMIYMRSDRNIVNGTKSMTAQTIGTTADYFRTVRLNTMAGRVLRETDDNSRRKVCVIGFEVRDMIFEPDEDPVGRYIKVNGIYFQVVGVVGRYSNSGMNVDNRVILPIYTMQEVFGHGNNFNSLTCTSKPGYSPGQVEQEVTAILKEAHDISPTDEMAVRSWNVEEEFKKINNVYLGVSILMWIVGLGALFSGVIGISNIMLVSIRERMREIGVRRALGATPGNIMGQIISESFVLTGLAGLAGFVLGTGIAAAMEYAMDGNSGDGGGLPFLPDFSLGQALGCLAILIASGIFAGILPAYRALKIKAIDAIRDE